jgi:hypothetical protein
MVKMGQKSIFHPRETHILARLDINVLYIIFLGVEKYRVWTQKPKGLTIRFTEKYLFMMKIS